MGFGLSANAFMNGLMRGYALSESIDERRRVLDERERQRQQQEGYARAVSQSMDNAQYQNVPYAATPDAAGQDLTDPEFGFKAAYGGGGPYAADVSRPGFGLSEIIGRRSSPDPGAFYQGAIRAAGEYGQAGALPGLMQGYLQDLTRQQNRSDQQEQTAYARGRDTVSDQRWAAQNALAQQQGVRAQESHVANMQKSASEQARQEAAMNGDILDALANILDPQTAGLKPLTPEESAQKAMEFVQLHPEVKNTLGAWGDKLLGLSPNPDKPGTYQALFDAGEGKAPTTMSIAPNDFRVFARAERLMGGAKPEAGKAVTPHFLYNQEGRKQGAVVGPNGEVTWLGGAEAPSGDPQQMTPREREMKAAGAVAQFYTEQSGMMKPQELEAGVARIYDIYQVDPKTRRALPTPPPPGDTPSLGSFNTGAAVPSAPPAPAGKAQPPLGAPPAASAWVQAAQAAGATRDEAIAEARRRIAAGRLSNDLK